MRRALHWLRRRLPRPARPAILMYHRVATPAHDPWGLSVAPALFRDQLQALRRRRQLLAMDEFVERLGRGTLPSRAVAITFDDGYVDNLTVAKPLLEQFGAPATMFVSTGSLGGENFWWDRLADMVMTYAAPLHQDVSVGGRSVAIDLPPLARDIEQPARPTIAGSSASARECCYFALWEALQPLLPEARARDLAALEALFGAPPVAAEDMPMSWEQARTLSSSLIAMGGHARTHHPLPTLPCDRQRAEIAGSAEDCAALTGHMPSGFAFPHGERTAETRALVRDAGFCWAVSTHEAAIDRSRFDVFDLPRVTVGPWSGEALLRRLGNLRGEQRGERSA